MAVPAVGDVGADEVVEFGWAKRIAVWLKRRLDQFWAWWKARRAQRATA